MSGITWPVQEISFSATFCRVVRSGPAVSFRGSGVPVDPRNLLGRTRLANDKQIPGNDIEPLFQHPLSSYDLTPAMPYSLSLEVFA